MVISFIFALAPLSRAADVMLTTKVTDDDITEINIKSHDDKILKTYKFNLSKHNFPVTEKTPAIKRWESYKFGAFVCYNSNQFTGQEHCKTRDPNVYNPTNLDVGNWIDVIKMIGMKYAVLTTRHTSGFLLWDSPTTDLDVGSSPVKTDVVKEFTDKCRQQGIAPGLYYCMWGGTFNKTPNSRAIILAQLYELAANYGEIPYFWIDMMYWAPDDLSAQQVYDLLKNLQPNTIVIINQHVQDGSKIRYFPTDVLNGEVKLPPPTGHQPIREVDGKKYYLPFEFEPISQWGTGWAKTPVGPGCWFTYGSGRSFKASLPLPPDALYKWIKEAYDRGASNVLLSIAPDFSGSMRQEDVKQLKQLSELLQEELKKLRSNP